MAIVSVACVGGDRPVSPAEAVDGLFSSEWFAYAVETPGGGDLPDTPEVLRFEGQVDLQAQAAKYTSNLGVAKPADVIVIGRDLYVPGEGEGQWVVSRRADSELPWVQELLPLSGSPLLAARSLREVESEPTEVSLEGDRGPCWKVVSAANDGTYTYCVDNDGRLSFLESTTPDGIVTTATYDPNAPRVAIEAPPSQSVQEFPTADAS